MAISIEEHVEKFWDVIDNHSLDNALMITKQRHQDTKELLDILEDDIKRTSYKSDIIQEMLVETRARYQYEQEWRKKIEKRLKTTRNNLPIDYSADC